MHHNVLLHNASICNETEAERGRGFDWHAMEISVLIFTDCCQRDDPLGRMSKVKFKGFEACLASLTSRLSRLSVLCLVYILRRFIF